MCNYLSLCVFPDGIKLKLITFEHGPIHLFDLSQLVRLHTGTGYYNHNNNNQNKNRHGSLIGLFCVCWLLLIETEWQVKSSVLRVRALLGFRCEQDCDESKCVGIRTRLRLTCQCLCYSDEMIKTMSFGESLLYLLRPFFSLSL